MTIAAIRKKLKTYVDDINDDKAKALYTLLADDIEESSLALTKEQLAIVRKEHTLHVAGKTKSYTWQQTKDIIRGKKAM